LADTKIISASVLCVAAACKSRVLSSKFIIAVFLCR
jgi:hypothetical protein